MEIREFAEQIFFGHSVADKLIAPEGGIRALTDREPGQEVAWQGTNTGQNPQNDNINKPVRPHTQ